MARKQSTAAPAEGKVKARVLADGLYGKVNDVVEVTEAEAAASSDLDAHPDAVAYAEGLAAAPTDEA